MAAWEAKSSPLVKFENSPAESFLSAPDDSYPSLFAAASPGASTMNPLEMMTPQSFDDDEADLSALVGLGGASTPAASGSEKKPVKKRKSWGQVLPEPKTNLPPRKRAKTEDEKEQRRVERVLRNRRAAQSSRERKRLEVEALEQRNRDLEVALLNAQKQNLLLVEELNKFRRNSGVVARSSNPVTLSHELFRSQDSNPAPSTPSPLDSLILPDAASATVNPASLSPELAPVSDADPSPNVDRNNTSAATPAAATAATSVDLTQRPAAMLCDLQCHQSTELARSWQASQSPVLPVLLFSLQLQTLLVASSAILSVCQRPLTQIAMSLKAGFSIPPTQSILRTIIWLVTLPRPTSRLWTSSTSQTISTTKLNRAARRPSQRIRNPSSASVATPTLRLRSLQKILTCSPNLARPLMDATMEAMRFVSEEREDRVEGSPAANGRTSTSREWLQGASLPSMEILLTLLWALKVEERKSRQPSSSAILRHGSDRTKTPTDKYILRVASPPSGLKRSAGESVGHTGKRCRLG